MYPATKRLIVPDGHCTQSPPPRPKPAFAADGRALRGGRKNCAAAGKGEERAGTCVRGATVIGRIIVRILPLLLPPVCEGLFPHRIITGCPSSRRVVCQVKVELAALLPRSGVWSDPRRRRRSRPSVRPSARRRARGNCRRRRPLRKQSAELKAATTRHGAFGLTVGS